MNARRVFGVVVFLSAGAACGGTVVLGKSLDSGTDVTAVTDGANACFAAGGSCLDPGGACFGKQSDLSCGASQTCCLPASTSHEGGAPGEASTSGETAASSDASSAPAVGSPACEDEPCVLCADGYYHCHSSVYPPCPADISVNTKCSGSGADNLGCITCSSTADGGLWQCRASSGKWNVTAYACTP
jgi:hypothetical protein